MRSARFLSWMSSLLMAVLSCLAAARAEEPGGRMALSAGPAGLEWRAEAEPERLVLTVAGPGGFFLRRELAAARGTLDLAGESGRPLVDGSYEWELLASPVIDEETRRALDEARRGEDAAGVLEALRAAGRIPRGSSQSGSFAVRDGAIVAPDFREGEPGAARSARGGSGIRSVAAELVVPEDLIVQGEACVGADCSAAETFGSDTFKLKANNIRVLFDDTSVTPGFPANDWRLVVNDSASGGVNHFTIEDVTSATFPFTIRSGAPGNSLFVSGSGKIGVRTSTPVLDLHVSSGNTPAFRLEQNATFGFPAQTWDVGANEANFFVRDVTGGSRLPLRIRPGAPTSSLDVAASGNVGVGTSSPDARLDVEASGSVELRLTAAGGSAWRLLNDASGFGTELAGSGFRAVNVDSAGNMQLHGTLTQGSSRDLKTGFATLDPREALARVSALPISLWSYKAEDPAVRHLGPMAEDFHRAFGLGADDRHIAPGDQAGVALLALQGLGQVVLEKDREIAELKIRLERLERRLAEMTADTAASPGNSSPDR